MNEYEVIEQIGRRGAFVAAILVDHRTEEKYDALVQVSDEPVSPWIYLPTPHSTYWRLYRDDSNICLPVDAVSLPSGPISNECL